MKENAKPLVLIGFDNAALGGPSTTNFNNPTSDGPIAVKTEVGWLVYGPYEAPFEHDPTRTSLHVIAIHHTMNA